MASVGAPTGSEYNGKWASEVENSAKRRIQNNEEQTQTRTRKLEKEYKEDLKESNDQASAHVERVKDEAKELRARDQVERANELEKTKNDIYSRYGKARDDENAQIKNAAQRTRDEIEAVGKDRLGKIEAEDSKRRIEIEKKWNIKAEENAFAERESRARETGDLRTQLLSVSEKERDAKKAAAAATYKVVNENEREHTNELKALQQSHDRDNFNNSKRIAELDRTYQGRTEDIVAHKQEVFEKSARNQSVSEQERSNMMKNSYERTITQKDAEMKLAEQNNAERSDQLLQKASENRQNSLDAQSTQFKKAIAERELGQRFEDRRRDTGDQEKLRNEAKGIISTAGENAVRRKLLTEVEKERNVERLQAKDQFASMKDYHTNRVAEIYDESANRERQVRTDFKSELSQKSQEHYESSQALEAAKRDEVAKLNQQQTRSQYLMAKENSKAAMSQTRHYDNLFDTQKQSFQSRVRAAQDEKEFDLKLADQSSRIKQTDLMHDFEKRLTNQKEEFEFAHENMKAEFEKKLQESERSKKNLLDDQARQYEHRLAQSELSSTERERAITRSYENEIDKLKRSNAQLIRNKKS